MQMTLLEFTCLLNCFLEFPKLDLLSRWQEVLRPSSTTLATST